MILVTRLDKQVMYLNPDQIVTIEETPDTVITLFNGNHFLVKERAQIIINRIIAFRGKLLRRTENRNKNHRYIARRNQGMFSSMPGNCLRRQADRYSLQSQDD